MVGDLKYLQRVMARKKIEAVLFWSLENIRYFSGFTGSDGALIIAGGERTFLSDSRYEEQAREETEDTAFQRYGQKIDGIVQFLRSLPVKRLGFESSALDFASYSKLKEKLPRITFVPLDTEIRNLRIRKESLEVEKIRGAVQIAEKSYADALPRLRPGGKEKAAANYLECRMRHRGADAVGFATIIASGPRASLPHGAASQKRLQGNETVVVDFGVRFQGYYSDETTTLILGKPSRQQKKIYDTVRRAQRKAMEAVRPGVKARIIDEAARDTIARAGYGKFFGHGTGHGVGLAVHEEPSISPRSRSTLEEGMVITIEPGIYIPGWGGVRLEDMILITGRGYEILTALSKEMGDNIDPRG